MATSVEYIEFVCEKICGNYDKRYKKMFGEYLVYVNEKPIFTVCNNCVFIKKLKEIENLMEGAEEGFPYQGAKEHYILDIENKQLTDKIVEILVEVTPVPKKRVKKSNFSNFNNYCSKEFL